MKVVGQKSNGYGLIYVAITQFLMLTKWVVEWEAYEVYGRLLQP